EPATRLRARERPEGDADERPRGRLPRREPDHPRRPAVHRALQPDDVCRGQNQRLGRHPRPPRERRARGRAVQVSVAVPPRRRLLIPLGAIGLTLAVLGSASAREQRYGGTLAVGVSQEPGSLDPTTVNGNTANEILRAMCLTLYSFVDNHGTDEYAPVL